MIRWVDPAGIARAVEELAASLRGQRPEITRILWYGSWIRGDATPGSDVDLCVVVSEDHRRPRERIPDYLPVRFPTGIDLTVVTEDEFAALER